MAWLAVIGAAGPACRRDGPGPPVPLAMEPAEAPEDETTPLLVRGEDFWALGRVSFVSRSRSEPPGAFTASLGGNALEDVQWVDGRTLAAVLPGTLPPGVYDLVVVDPAGREGALAAAFTVLQRCSAAAECDDADTCNGAETCDGEGLCRPGSALACDDGDPCTADACDPAAGCLGPAAPDGTPCDDGAWCTEGEACTAGDCGGGTPRLCDDGDPATLDQCDEALDACTTGATCGPNTPPLAGWAPAPGGGTTATVFAFDAAPSSDLEDADGSLAFQWDWESDGLWDATGIAPTVAFGSAGLWTITMRVTDSCGLSDELVGWVVVSDSADLLVVTTGDDVVDSADGLTSLREAVSTANASPGSETITFDGPMTVMLTDRIQTLSSEPITIVGQPGVVIDGSLLTMTDPCFQIDEGDALLWLEVANCDGPAVMSTGPGDWIAHCVLRDSGYTGVHVQGATTVMGPGNDIHGHEGSGIWCDGADCSIEGNRIHDNAGSGISFSGDRAMAWRNAIWGNANGVGVGMANVDSVAWHNVLHGNGGSGISAPSSAGGLDVRDNVFSGNTGAGVDVPAGSLAAFDFNAFFANLGGDCTGCTLGAGSVTADPGWLDVAALDFRLSPTSPCIDAGMDVGLDRNGSAAGLWNGAAPDIGAWEAP